MIITYDTYDVCGFLEWDVKELNDVNKSDMNSSLVWGFLQQLLRLQRARSHHNRLFIHGQCVQLQGRSDKHEMWKGTLSIRNVGIDHQLSFNHPPKPPKDQGQAAWAEEVATQEVLHQDL